MLNLETLAELLDSNREAYQAEVTPITFADKVLLGPRKPAIMGVINLSPDSWYRESVCLSTEQAIRRAEVLLAQGADLIDLGAESTLPHASKVEVDRQWDRLAPVAEGMLARGALVSLETYHPALASRALEAGVQVINLTGPVGSADIYEACAAHDAGVIICYVQGDHVRDVERLDFDGDPVEIMSRWFEEEIGKAEKAGVRKMILDPGLGFYYRNLKDSVLRIQYQMKMFLNTFRLRKHGWPVCHALPHAFEIFGEEVRTAESFFATLALLGKTDLLRTHEVSKVRAVLDTMEQYASAP